MVLVGVVSRARIQGDTALEPAGSRGKTRRGSQHFRMEKYIEKSSLPLPKTLHVSRMLLVPTGLKLSPKLRGLKYHFLYIL